MAVNFSNYQYAYLIANAADTIVRNDNKKTNLQMPNQFSFGTLLANGELWKVGIDGKMGNWSTFRNDAKPDSTANNWMVKLGGSYRKTSIENTRYSEKIEYRFGVFTGTDYLQFNNKNLAITAATVGLGLPLKIKKASYGTINLALQTGARGTTDNNLIRERFTTFSLGISVSEKWFLKRRYD
jgi:Tfp pilus assembly protein PilW